jgi:LysR family transcriptional regulator, transcriptional activator of the cysJI operon
MPARATLDQLEAFTAVCQTGSFSRAASLLHLTQPALSHRIRSLEQHIGARLLLRGAPATPTPAGAVLLGYSERLLALANDAERAVHDQAIRRLEGHLRVAASSSWGFYLLPPALSSFHTQFPDLAVDIVMIANSSELIQAVLSDQADIAIGIIDPSPTTRRLRRHELMTDEWYLVASALDAAIPKSTTVSPRVLDGKRIIIREGGSATRSLLERILSDEGINPEAVLEFSSTEAVKKAVEHNLGVSLIAGATIRDEVEAGTLRALRLRGHRIELPYWAATDADRYLPLASQKFLDFVKKLSYERPLP